MQIQNFGESHNKYLRAAYTRLFNISVAFRAMDFQISVYAIQLEYFCFSDTKPGRLTPNALIANSNFSTSSTG